MRVLQWEYNLICGVRRGVLDRVTSQLRSREWEEVCQAEIWKCVGFFFFFWLSPWLERFDWHSQDNHPLTKLCEITHHCFKPFSLRVFCCFASTRPSQGADELKMAFQSSWHITDIKAWFSTLFQTKNYKAPWLDPAFNYFVATVMEGAISI